MKSSTVSFHVLIFIFISPLFSMATDGRFEKRKFDQYTVSLSQLFESGLGTLLISRGKNKVFKEAEVDHHYYFGNHFDETSKGADLYSGHDITGNGIPNLVVSNWTGGAHCCHFMTIFEMGKNLKKLITVDAKSSDIRLVDLDNDGFPEVEFWDGSIDYLFASFAGSPGGRVVLKFHKGQYEVATELMKKPPPSLTEIDKIKKKIRAAFEEHRNDDLPFVLLDTMMDLSYSGHMAQALKVASETWPSARQDYPSFKQRFVQALRKSLYWRPF